MKALVVRQNGTHAILAVGPANGMYDPAYDPATQTKQEEADYAAVQQEWQASLPPSVDKRAMVLQDVRVPQWFKDWIAS